VQHTTSRTRFALALVLSLSLIALPIFPLGHTAQASSSGTAGARRSEVTPPAAAQDVATLKAKAQACANRQTLKMSFAGNES
jgi:hypothetical protein